MKQCKTCKEIEEIGEINKLYDFKGNWTKVLKVKLTQITYADNKARGTLTYGGRPLKFCPECGKKIERTQTVWHGRGQR